MAADTTTADTGAAAAAAACPPAACGPPPRRPWAERDDCVFDPSFSWFWSIIRKGGSVKDADLFALDARDESLVLSAALNRCWAAERKAHPRSPRLWRALFRTFVVETEFGWTSGFTLLAEGLCKLAVALLLGEMIDYISSDGSLPLARGLTIAGCMCFLSITAGVFHHVVRLPSSAVAPKAQRRRGLERPLHSETLLTLLTA